jgi:hypothetical protein
MAVAWILVLCWNFVPSNRRRDLLALPSRANEQNDVQPERSVDKMEYIPLALLE